MMSNPTKHYSDKQETIVAEYLGWKRVSASGARPFNKGDIVSDSWLCECKTHTAHVDSMKILKSVWKKLKSESMSCMKRPILIIDDGTQKIASQVVVVESKFFSGPFFTVNAAKSDGFNLNASSITFPSIICGRMKKEKIIFAVDVNGDELLIMPIEFFKVSGGFYDNCSTVRN